MLHEIIHSDRQHSPDPANHSPNSYMSTLSGQKDPVRLSQLSQTDQAAFAASSFSSWFSNM